MMAFIALGTIGPGDVNVTPKFHMIVRSLKSQQLQMSPQ